MSLQDLFTSNILSNSTAVTGFDMAAALALSFGIGLFIAIVYRRVNYSAIYSESFGVSLLALCMITTTLILAVSSSVVLSLGMLGALSIVRFRAAIKDPVEMAFLFWSVEAGTVLAAGILPLAIAVNVAIGVVLLVWVKRKPGAPYILVLQCEENNLNGENGIMEYIQKSVKTFVVKSRTTTTLTEADGVTETDSRIPVLGEDSAGFPDQMLKTEQSRTRRLPRLELIELTIEVTLKESGKRFKDANTGTEDGTAFVDELNSKRGVHKAVLVAYNGNYM